MGEKSIAPPAKFLRLLRRSTIVTSRKTTTMATTAAVEKTTTIAGLLWKKDAAEVEAFEVEGWEGVGDWEACTLVINVSVSLELEFEVVATIGAELECGVSEGVEDVVRVEE